MLENSDIKMRQFLSKKEDYSDLETQEVHMLNNLIATFENQIIQNLKAERNTESKG